MPDGRQAVAALRGYVYQVWQTVLAWMRLSDDEALYLEMAEDFDLEAPAGTTVVQVKHSDVPRVLSIGGNAAAEALNNFWTIATLNQGTQVRFRLLTTWRRGVERGSPFAPQTGLDYWDSCRDDQSRIPKLRDYLLQLSGLSSELLAFLRQADAVSIQQRLVACVYWDTGHESLPSMEQLVDEALAGLAEKCGFPVLRTRLDVVRSALLAHAVARITDRNPSARRLTRKTCLDVMRDALSVQVPVTDWDRINSQLNEFAALKNALPPDVASTRISEGYHGRLMTLPPDEGARWVRRVQCAACVDLVRRLRVVFLHASRGTGKSSLARQIANGIGGDWLVVDFQGHDSRASGQLLRGIHSLLDYRKATASIVVDNIDVNAAVDQYEPDLASLVRRQNACNAAVIVTATSPARKDFLRGCGLAEDAVVLVARFDDSEIRQCLEQAGCPQLSVDQWIRVIRVATDSHPQLVHALVLDAKQRGWPTPRLNDIVRPASVQEERDQAFSRLLGTSPAALAMRVSMLRGVFVRDVALATAEADPALKCAASDFESLVGPWVEPVARDYFRVSPLLAGADAKLSPRERESVAAAGAIATLKRRHLSPGEFACALMLSLTAKHDALVARCAQVLASPQERDIAIEVAEEMRWLLALGVDGPAYRGNQFANAMIRMAQATIASRLHEWVRLSQIVGSWRAEIAAVTDAVVRHVFTSLLTIRLLLDINAPYGAQLVVGAMDDALALPSRGAAIGAPELLEQGKTSRIFLLLDLQAARIKNATQLVQYVQAIDARPSLRKHLVERWNSGEGLEAVDGICDRAWLADCERGGLGAEQCALLLASGMEIVAKWSCEFVLVQFCQALSVVKQEYLRDAAGAHKVLDDAEKLVGAGNRNILLQRAKLCYQQRRFEEAAPLFIAGRGGWKDHAISGAFGARMAAMNSGEIGDWDSAEEYLREARGFAVKYQPVMRLGLELDMACLQFLRGRHAAAIACFADGMLEYERAYLDSKDALHISLRRRIAHALLRLRESPGSASEPKNLVGWISSQDPLVGIEQLPEQPWQATWLLLRELCVDRIVDVAVVDRHLDLACIDQCGAMASMRDMQTLTLACGGASMDGVVAACLRVLEFARSTKLDVARYIMEQAPANVNGITMTPELIESVGMTMWLAVTGVGLRDGWPPTAAESLRLQFQSINISDEGAAQWIAACERATNATEPELADMEKAEWLGTKLFAASGIVVRCRVGPSHWWRAVAMVMQGAHRLAWRHRFATLLAEVMQRELKRLAETQPFALRAPRVNVPNLIQVAAKENRGWQTCAECCLSAVDGLGLRIDSRVAAMMTAWASTTLN